jgi:hypothetical protein
VFCVFILFNLCVIFFCFYVVLCVRTYPNTFERVHGAAFDLALVSSAAAPLHTRTALHACVRTCLHTFERMTHTQTHALARVRSNVPMYVQTYLILGQREQFFLGHIFFSFSHFFPSSRTTRNLPSVPLLPKIQKPRNPPPPITSPTEAGPIPQCLLLIPPRILVFHS